MQSFPSCRLWVVEQIHQTEMRIVLNHATGRSEGETNPAGRIHPAAPSVSGSSQNLFFSMSHMRRA